jgi:parvulin-like peptidyl-prolyl isomerase
MKPHRLAPLLAGLLTAIAAAGDAGLSMKDAVVAVVNDRAITRDAVEGRIAELIETREPGLSPEAAAEQQRRLFSAAREALIAEQLVLAEADRLIAERPAFEPILEHMAQERIESARAKAGGDAALRAQVKEEGLAFDAYVEQVRAGMKRRVVLEQFVEKDLSASPAELRDHYRRNLPRFRTPTRVRCRLIIVSGGGPSDRPQALKTAAYVMELIEKDHDFVRLAKQYSDGPHAAEGGLWDYARPEAFLPPVARVLEGLAVNDVSGPIETDEGFTIVKVVGRKEGRLAPYEEVQDELEREVIAAKRRERMDRLIERLEREHYVKRLP